MRGWRESTLIWTLVGDEAEATTPPAVVPHNACTTRYIYKYTRGLPRYCADMHLPYDLTVLQFRNNDQPIDLWRCDEYSPGGNTQRACLNLCRDPGSAVHK